MCPQPIPRRFTLAAVFLWVLLVPGLGAGGQEDDRAAVIGVVQELFDAMAAGDGTIVERLLLEDARLASVRLDPDGERLLRSQDRAGFVAAIADADADLLERMWEPQVRVHGDIASLWAPYDFWIDGERSHCGIDDFQLLRTDLGWRIAHVAYTVQRDDCPPSPLGPPR